MKNAIREVDWTYRFFTCGNIAHIEFYVQGLLPKILAIYTIKSFIVCIARILGNENHFVNFTRATFALATHVDTSMHKDRLYQQVCRGHKDLFYRKYSVEKKKNV